jgi:hypothetical protein
MSMTDLKRTARRALALGLLSLFALGASVFALNDIAHVEPDLTIEWAVVRVSALIVLMFIALSFVALTRVLRLPHQE